MSPNRPAVQVSQNTGRYYGYKRGSTRIHYDQLHMCVHRLDSSVKKIMWPLLTDCCAHNLLQVFYLRDFFPVKEKNCGLYERCWGATYLFAASFLLSLTILFCPQNNFFLLIIIIILFCPQNKTVNPEIYSSNRFTIKAF